MLNRSRFFAVIAAGSLMGLTACGGGSDAATGSTDDVAKIGAILSMSGTNSTLGPPEKNAMTMGVEALNKEGFTVAGKKYTLEVEYADDKSDAATTGTTEFRQMTQSDALPLVAVGLGTSSYAPLLQRQPVPVVNILDSTYPSILDYDPHLFLLRGDSTTYVPGCLTYAKDKLGATNFSVISPTGEPYGEGLTQLVQKSASSAGVTVGTVAEYPLGTSDFGNAIREALSTNPDAIYLSSVTAVQLPVLKQLRQAGYTGPVFHSSGVNPEQAKSILGGDFNTIMQDNYDCAGTLSTTSDQPAAKAFAQEYQSRFNEYPQDLTGWAYDFPFVVAAAMSAAGSITDSDKIYEALQTMPVPEGTVSGWLPGADGQLFTDRGARTASEVTAWCSDKQTIASALVFEVDENGVVTNPQYRDDPCAAAS